MNGKQLGYILQNQSRRYNNLNPSSKSPYNKPMREASISFIKRESPFLIESFLLNRTKNSKINTAKKAPIGSMNCKTPLIVPTELPRKKPVSRTIKSNEYLRHGLIAQTCRRLNPFPKLR